MLASPAPPVKGEERPRAKRTPPAYLFPGETWPEWLPIDDHFDALERERTKEVRA